MLVGEWMTKDPITVEPKISIRAAWKLMQEHQICHLPVVKAGKLVGMVSDRDLRLELPSPSTSLAAHELQYILEKLTVSEVMRKEVITTAPWIPLLDAAHVLLRNHLEVLAVLVGGVLGGILTVTDVLRAFVAVVGAGRGSLTAPPPDASVHGITGAGERRVTSLGDRWARRLG